jgi:triacylglycerol lipase
MSPRTTHHVFLVPGFLGIESLGEVVYFAHVRDLLTEQLRARGVDAEIHAVRNHATSSIRKRTLRLLETIQARAGQSDAPLHLIGHSTGGLDARLLCTPGASLTDAADVEAVATRVRSIVSIACPHRGTPLASFFTTRLGGQLLRVLSLGTTYILRFGRLPLSVVVRLAGLFVRMHSRLGRLEHTIADQMFVQLLGDFSAERRDELNLLFADMAGDVGLMPQLMPEAMDMFDAAVGERAAIRCGSVVAAARPGLLRNTLQLGLDPYAQATHALFEALSRLSAEMPAVYLPKLTAAQLSLLRQGLDREPSDRDNDGIVPLLSQVWGELIHVAQADHFDVIGHFSEPKLEPPHYDWLASCSQFDQAAFERLWTDVAEFIAGSC